MYKNFTDIPWYKGLYWINKYSEIISFQRKMPIILKSSTDRYWYKKVVLTKDWITKTYRVHRLMAITFMWLDNNSNMVVCHKDDNPKNNNINNLFLGSQKDNMQDMVSKWRNKNWLEQIAFMRKLYDKYKKWKIIILE